MELNQEVAILRKEMDEVRETVRHLDVRTIAQDKTLAIIRENLSYIKTSQDKLNANVSRALWAFATVFIVGLATWIMGGGIALP